VHVTAFSLRGGRFFWTRCSYKQLMSWCILFYATAEVFCSYECVSTGKYTLNGTSAKYSAIHVGSRWNSKCFKIQQLSLTFDINQYQPYNKININIRINRT